MCGCEHHRDHNAPCTCTCPDHKAVREEMSRNAPMSATDHTLTDAEREAVLRAHVHISPRDLLAAVESILAARLATAEAEKEALRAERDEIADRLSVVLCDLTGGKLSKTGYSAQTMIQAVEEEFEQHAEAAEAALAGLVAAVEALVDEWLSEEARLKALADEEDAVDLRVSLLKASGSFRGAAIVLRALLTADHAAALRAREAKVLRDAADAWAEGEWNDAFASTRVVDDLSAVQAMETWLRDRADSIEQARP